MGLSKEEVSKRFKEFPGIKVTIENTGRMIKDARVHMLHNSGREGLCEEPNGLNTGSNSGYQVVNFAALAGAKRVLLLGYDMKFPGGKSHWHGGHPVKHPEAAYSRYARNFKTMVPQLAKMGCEVINCTPDSAIDAFPRGEIESVLAHTG